MSALSSIFALAVKEASHIKPADIEKAAQLGKELFDFVSSLQAGRNKDAALNALETAALHIANAVKVAPAGAKQTTKK